MLFKEALHFGDHELIMQPGFGMSSWRLRAINNVINIVLLLSRLASVTRSHGKYMGFRTIIS